MLRVIRMCFFGLVAATMASAQVKVKLNTAVVDPGTGKLKLPVEMYHPAVQPPVRQKLPLTSQDVSALQWKISLDKGVIAGLTCTTELPGKKCRAAKDGTTMTFSLEGDNSALKDGVVADILFSVTPKSGPLLLVVSNDLMVK